MNRKQMKRVLAIGILVALTGIAMAYARHKNSEPYTPPVTVQGKKGVLTLTGSLTQDKVLFGSDGITGLSLKLRADEVLGADDQGTRNVDMVIILDRSGSMSGKKIAYARQAVLHLLSHLTANDRFALVTYSDGAREESGLAPVTDGFREHMDSIVRHVSAGGGTNLGGGLQAGIDILENSGQRNNPGRVILISDGLANQGITDPKALGEMAAGAVTGEFAVTTVGVGSDFNEQLMTALADRGTGNYYYLENPGTFAAIFQKEFHSTRVVAASSVEIQVPLSREVSLLEAGGYPIEVREGVAIFRPGDILSGQSRKLFLSLKVPTNKEGDFSLEGVSVRYLHEGKMQKITLDKPFRLACVKKKQEVWASIDQEVWEEKVLQEDYNRLRENVARDIKGGDKDMAKKRIQNYYDARQSINARVKSEAVEENLKRDLGSLREMVDETFDGNEQEVKTKQKQNAKSIQFEGYLGRRGKK